MVKKFAVVQMLIVLSLLFAGCPGAGGSLVGTWVLSAAPANFGLDLKANGSATSFAAPDILPGTLSWEVNGTEFSLRQEVGASRTIWIGRVTGGNAISGAFIIWEGAGLGNGGTWSATKQ